MQNLQDVQQAAETLKASFPENYANALSSGCAIILGTGLSGVARSLCDSPIEIPFASLPKFPTPGVDSHAGSFIAGWASNRPVLFQCGRVHLYEGYSADDVCAGCRVMASLGIRKLIITNAAGALNPLFEAGSMMLISDIINHTGISPLTGSNWDSFGERFPDMSEPYSRKFLNLAASCALQERIHVEKGVYIGVHGPEMETPAETRMYRQWGADAIGMSTALETIAARHCRMECLGISCLTNKNLPDCMEEAPLEKVLQTANAITPKLARLLKAILLSLPA